MCASVLRSEETETKVSTVKEVGKQRGRHSRKQVMGQYCDAGAESTFLNSTGVIQKASGGGDLLENKWDLARRKGNVR